MADLSFSWTVSAENKTRIINGIAYQHGYQDQIEDPDNPEQMIPNPEGKGAFCKRMTKEWIRANVRAYEANQAVIIARDAKIAEVDAIDIAD